MKNKINSILAKGKTEKKNKKVERFINYSVLIGFGFMLFWILFLYPIVFINIKLILSILFIPALIITPFLSKKIISSLGYQLKIKDSQNYNFLIRFATYVLIMMPIGNFLVATFLGTNILFKEENIETIYIKPQNIYEKKHGVKSAEINYNNTSKRINFREISTKELQSKKVKIDISKGFWGYHVIVKRTLI